MFTIQTSNEEYQYSIDDGRDGDPPGLQIWEMREFGSPAVLVWQQVAKVTADQLAQALKAAGHNPPATAPSP